MRQSNRLLPNAVWGGNFHRTRGGNLSDYHPGGKKLSKNDKTTLKRKMSELLDNFDLRNFGFLELEKTYLLINLTQNYPVLFAKEINEIFDRLIRLENYDGVRLFNRNRFILESNQIFEQMLRNKDYENMEKFQEIKEELLKFARGGYDITGTVRKLKGHRRVRTSDLSRPPRINPRMIIGLTPRQQEDLYLNLDLTKMIAMELEKLYKLDYNILRSRKLLRDYEASGNF